MIVAAVVMSVGFYVAIMTVQAQWSGEATFVTVAAWYALAFIIFGFGKMAKWKSVECCGAHGKF
jgi:hypothetical protein